MLLIKCPWCGPRDEIEFRCGGEAQRQRPEPYDQVTDEAWAAYLFTRVNTKGGSLERWHHAHGCRQWFKVERNTSSHEIVATYPIEDVSPVDAQVPDLRRRPKARTA